MWKDLWKFVQFNIVQRSVEQYQHYEYFCNHPTKSVKWAEGALFP